MKNSFDKASKREDPNLYGITRRRFIESSCVLLASGLLGERRAFASDDQFLKEAAFYRKLPEMRVECMLCPRKCIVGDLGRGDCRVRENREGKYYTLVHSRACTFHVDPIEKKPLFHYRPGTQAYSLATVGCNMDCKYCQNWTISQCTPEDGESYYLPPEKVIAEAKKYGCRSVACTYSEPVVFYEYMYDIAVAGKEKGVPSVMVSNGYILPEPMKRLCKVLDAVKIDLKGFTEKFYRNICRGSLKPVLATLDLLAASDTWYEIVVLIVPTLNDAKEDVRRMCRWIHDKLGPNVPVHFSRFHPTYKLKNIFPTPIKTLERCYDTARDAGLNYVYLGNVPRHRAENTFCPNCGRSVIKRIGYTVVSTNLQHGRCPDCGTAVPGVWE